MFAHEKLRQGCQELLERLQVRSAAEEIVQHFVLNVRHQFDEHLVSLGLVLDERILLRVTAQIDALAQCVHGVEMLLPEAIDRVENDVALQAFNGGRLFVTRFPLVRILDLLDQKLRVFINRARIELRFFLRQSRAGRWCSPNG